MELPKRKHPRLKEYDYSQNGVYYITICVQNRAPLLWEPIVGARIARPQVTDALSEYGRIIQYAIEQSNVRYPMVTVDKYVIMPNHIHMLIVIANGDGRAMRAPTISTVINQMKGYVTKQIGKSIWQKLFYDRVMRNEEEYLTKWNYIDENPLRWMDDEYYI